MSEGRDAILAFVTPPDPHDRLFHAAFSRPSLLREFLEHYLDADVAALLDLDRVEVVQESFVDPDLQKHSSDLLVEVGRRDTPDDTTSIYILLEHKSYPDADTPLQLLRYMVAIWQRDRAAGRPLRPIVPVIVHHGPRPWTPRTLRALVEPPVALARFVPHFDCVVVDLSRIPDEDILARESPEVRVVALVLKHVFGPLREQLDVVGRELASAARQPGGEDFVETVLTYLAGAGERLQRGDLARLLRSIPEGRSMMPTIADEYRAEGAAPVLVLLRQTIADVLRFRFGTLPAVLERRLERADLETLEALRPQLLRADTLADVTAQLPD